MSKTGAPLLLRLFARLLIVCSSAPPLGCASCPVKSASGEAVTGSPSVPHPLRSFSSCLQKLHLDERARAANRLCSEAIWPSSTQDLIPCAGPSAPTQDDAIAACAAFALDASGTRGDDDADPPQQLLPEQFATRGELLLAMSGSTPEALGAVHDLLAENGWLLSESNSTAERVVVVHNIAIEDDGNRHRTVSIRLRLPAAEAPGCTRAYVAWLVQVRGTRDKAWQIGKDQSTPPIVTQAIKRLSAKECP